MNYLLIEESYRSILSNKKENQNKKQKKKFFFSFKFVTPLL